MKIAEMCQLEFDAKYGSYYSQDGKFIVFCKADELEVIELESQNGHTVQYILKDQTIHTYYPFKVAFFEDYIVLASISQVQDQEQYLMLLKYNFRSGLSQKLNLPFPHIDWNDSSRPKVSFYPKLPANVCEDFRADFLYFEDPLLSRIFETEKIVVEVRGLGGSDYQITDVSHVLRLLLPYNTNEPSPFTMPYLSEWTDMSKCRLIKYRNGISPQSHLWILNKYAYISTIRDSLLFINQFFDNQALLTSRTKILRKFCYLHQTELYSHYIIMKQGQGTIRIDMRTAQAIWISQHQDTILRGKYIFTARKSSNPLTPTLSELQLSKIV